MRYALASSLEVPNDRVRYFPANPSSYTYLDGLRPVQPDPWQCDSFCVNATLMTRQMALAKPSSAATTCRTTSMGTGRRGCYRPTSQRAACLR